MFNMYNINKETEERENEYFNYYTIKKGDTIYQIARDYKVNPTLLALLNGLNSTDYIYPDQSIMIPKKDFAYYITKEGDTLKTVADTFNTNVSNLLKYNDTIYLQEGQLIVNKIYSFTFFHNICE